MSINNCYIKKILLFFYKKEKNSITDYELIFLKKAILSLLNDNIRNLCESDIINCNFVASYNNIKKIYFDSNEFIINGTQKTFLDILLNNYNFNYSYKDQLELINICKTIDLYNNKIININNLIFDNNKNILKSNLFDNYNKIEKIILEDFNKKMK